MGLPFQPVSRQTLSDDIAQRITRLISSGGYTTGSRLPTISVMARDFGVGAPTLREALKKLETVGAVAIRHGSGVYVGRPADSMLMSNPVFGAQPTRKLLIDLIEARMPIEIETARLAARNATAAQLDEMKRLLSKASGSMGDAATLSDTNMSFHQHIALSSGNLVLHQMLEVLSTIFRREQRQILDIHGRRRDDHAEHEEIFAAIRAHDEVRAMQRMHGHLERVRDVLAQWNAESLDIIN